MNEQISIRHVANGYIVEPTDGPGVARDRAKDTFVFESMDALVKYMAEHFSEGEK